MESIFHPLSVFQYFLLGFMISKTLDHSMGVHTGLQSHISPLSPYYLKILNLLKFLAIDLNLFQRS